VIIDPGMDALSLVKSLVTQYSMTPVAVLATHGHVDHVADAAVVADHYQIPTWIHSSDRHLLCDPASGLSADMAAWLAVALPRPLTEPARVEILDNTDTLSFAGLTLSVIHAPGHTPGSVMYLCETGSPLPTHPDSSHPQEDYLAFTGDVLFAGSIGRTDLPGGDLRTMLATLNGPVLSLPDSARILPGHGPSSTMAVERATNPYLSARFLR